MAEEKVTRLGYLIILILFVNTLFLGGIFYTLQQCSYGKMMCAKGDKPYICPFTKKAMSMEGMGGK